MTIFCILSKIANFSMGVTWLRQEQIGHGGMSLRNQRKNSKLNLNANNAKFAPAYAKIA